MNKFNFLIKNILKSITCFSNLPKVGKHSEGLENFYFNKTNLIVSI